MADRIFRFRVGQRVWVRDRGHGPHGSGYRIVEAVVREQHQHPGRHPWYPNGEGYSLDGQLWWDCYPGCRVFRTREEALAARLPKEDAVYYTELAAKILAQAQESHEAARTVRMKRG